MKKYIHDLKVLSNRILSDDVFVLELQLPDQTIEALPGQFAEVLIRDSEKVFLRRPFSIHDFDASKNRIKLMVKIVGDGTRKLSQLHKGELLNLVYPLGNGFTISNGKKVLLTGGGCGIAPMLFLAKQLYSRSNKTDILLGGRSADDILEQEEFELCGNVFVTTDDGSDGEKGLITDHTLLNDPKDYDIIYCCGPLPMMKAMASFANKHNLECEVSLENTMACGVGACLCCVTETTDGNICVCTEGPVFNTKRLKWQT